MRSYHNEAILTKQQFKQLYQETVSHNNDNGFSNVGRTRLKALTTSLYTYMLRNAMFAMTQRRYLRVKTREASQRVHCS